VGRNGTDNEDETGEGYVHDDPIADAALEWFARLRNAEPDARTMRDFQAWLDHNTRHAEEFHALEAMWGSSAFAKAVASLPMAESAAKQTAASRRQGLRWLPRLAAAAAVVLAVLGAWQYPKLMLAWQADYITATGDQSTIHLPDGSTMILNTASAVAFDFQNGQRTVRLLKGEAFFDVQHDASHPFRVTGHFGEVEVTGTAFSVRADADSDDVVLERGHVEVTCLCNAAEQVRLEPDEAVTATATSLSAVRKTDPSRALAWRDGRVIFDDQPLGTVLNELRRYYGGTIIVADSRISRLIVTGNYRLDSIEGAIRTLADAAGVGMTRIPGGIIILR